VAVKAASLSQEDLQHDARIVVGGVVSHCREYVLPAGEQKRETEDEHGVWVGVGGKRGLVREEGSRHGTHV